MGGLGQGEDYCSFGVKALILSAWMSPASNVKATKAATVAKRAKAPSINVPAIGEARSDAIKLIARNPQALQSAMRVAAAMNRNRQ